jgi:predicted metal-dependent hydrolase
MEKRNEDVDRLVRERLKWLEREIEDREKDVAGTEERLARLKWLEREIEDREKDVAGTEERLAKTREAQTEALGERARLLAFLGEG